MRARYKSPTGNGTVEVADNATLQTVLDELRSRTGLQRFTVKFGPPMAMQTLDLSRHAETARSLGLHGETLTIVPDEPRPVTPVLAEALAPSQPSAGPQLSTTQDNPGDINIPWPERDGNTPVRIHRKNFDYKG